MKLENGRISASQLIFLIMGTSLGYTVILIPAQAAKHLAWLAVLVSTLEALFFVIVQMSLAMRFPGKTLIEFNDIIFGPIGGKIISACYLWFFLHTASLVSRVLSDFFVGVVLPETPMIVFLLSIIIICASAVRNGIEVIARCCIILTIITILFLTSNTLMLLNEADLSNLLPIADVPWQDFISASNASATVCYGLTPAFLMVYAFLNKPEKTKKAGLAVMILGFFLTIITARNIAVLGSIVNIATYPSYTATQMISIGEFLTRLEVSAAVVFLAMAPISISFLYYTVVLGIAQLLKLRSYLPLVLPVGVLIINLGITNFDSVIEELDFAANYYPFYAIPFQIGLPLLSLLIAVIRGMPKEAKGSSEGAV